MSQVMTSIADPQREAAYRHVGLDTNFTPSTSLHMNWVSSLLSDQSFPLLSYQANARDYSQWTVIA